MKKMINTEHIEGRVYQHNLIKKTVQTQTSPNFGKEFISGNLEIAVDEEGLVIIPVHFTYVTETTANGNKNITYANLEKIMNDNNTWILNGKEDAIKVKIDTALSVNDFYGRDDKLITSKVNEGGFVNIVSELCPENERNTFTTDILINQVVRTEADPEKNVNADYVTIKGAVFNFRNELLPVDFIVRNPEGMDYFEDLEATKLNPVLTKVWGKIDCRTLFNEVKEETAFGEESVRTFEKKVKEWIVTGGAKVPYDFGDETVLTEAELTKAIQDRELKLADVKKRREEYQAQKAETPTIAATSVEVNTKTETFNF